MKNTSEAHKSLEEKLGLMNPLFYHVENPKVDHEFLPQFEAALESAKVGTWQEFVINMANVKHMSNKGFAAILELHTWANKNNRKVILIDTDPKSQVRSKMDTTGLTLILNQETS